MIRTDNETCFNSALMKIILRILSIKHHTIKKHCSWQNGRIERFFGTFKKAIKPINTSQENHWFL
jgi:putative transposase